MRSDFRACDRWIRWIVQNQYLLEAQANFIQGLKVTHVAKWGRIEWADTFTTAKWIMYDAFARNLSFYVSEKIACKSSETKIVNIKIQFEVDDSYQLCASGFAWGEKFLRESKNGDELGKWRRNNKKLKFYRNLFCKKLNFLFILKVFESNHKKSFFKLLEKKKLIASGY